jgi:hypothetical protein
MTRRRHQHTSKAAFEARSYKVRAGSSPLPFTLSSPHHSICRIGLGYNYTAISSPYSLIFAAYCCFHLRALGEIPFIKFITRYLPGPSVISTSLCLLLRGLTGPGSLSTGWWGRTGKQAKRSCPSQLNKGSQQTGCGERAMCTTADETK